MSISIIVRLLLPILSVLVKNTPTIPATAASATTNQAAASTAKNDGLFYLYQMAVDNGVHHEHKDGQVHFYYYEGIRKKDCRFSLRCICTKLVLALVHIIVLLIMTCHFLHHVCHWQ
ncbi:MAG: hypothetical protein RL172_3273 [Bacteroidota bacterium]|jgi:hypothetical protein